MQNYKQYHEDFMQNLNGTTSLETFSLIFPSAFNIFIATTTAAIILDNLFVSRSKCLCIHFIIDFFSIIIPMILCITILDKITIYYILLLIFACAALVFVLYSKIPIKIIRKNFSSSAKRHFITNARASINILSIVAILAVDFKIFPRRFAKTETFGYSLMDVGVGLFVFSNGIVAPEITKKSQTVVKSVISSTPLWLLGCARFFVTKETDYHVHVSEYGVHWNFFITLAVSKILSSLVLTVISIKHSLLISLIVLTLHESLLQLGLSDWVLSNNPRNTFMLANREGIVSSLGYVGLYFLSVHAGKVLSKSKGNHKLDIKLGIQLLLLSFLFICSVLLLEKYFGISRRLANSGYCLWILFLGTFMCFLFLCVEHINKYLYNISNQTHRIFVPLIFEAVNYNGLACFLLANILTGLINLSIQTLTTEPLNSLIIITLYMFVTCSIMSVLYVKNIKLKLW